MSLAIHLLGRPHLERDGEPAPSPRGFKAWGLLAYLTLSRVRNPSREQLAELLFAGTDDPLGSLRWNLAELRRRLGRRLQIGGDCSVGYGLHLNVGDDSREDLWGAGLALTNPEGAEIHLVDARLLHGRRVPPAPRTVGALDASR